MLVPSLLAAQPFGGRKIRSALATTGLLTGAAIGVHLSGGAIEAHFQFFVIIPVLMLYQDWLPFLLAIGYVLVEHGVVGVLIPASVYNHGAAGTPMVVGWHTRCFRCRRLCGVHYALAAG